MDASDNKLSAKHSNKLSTTALAKKLNIPVQQLFATLKDYDWIRRGEDGWRLTAKGEFEGGSYQKSRRYGPYIVWPEHLDQHPLLAAIESNQRITAASMCRYYPHMHARQINRALAELGLQQHSILGWELTPAGRALGGQQEESENSGAFYVTWPHEIIDNPVLNRDLGRLAQHDTAAVSEGELEPDLFGGAVSRPMSCQGVDGHVLESPLQTLVCNWLYLAQLAHARQRALPTEELVYADFYVPAGNVYIDCWETDISASELSLKLHKRELYTKLDLRNLEINPSDEKKLDEVLGRGLLGFGIRS
jgi:hypothetical protein